MVRQSWFFCFTASNSVQPVQVGNVQPATDDNPTLPVNTQRPTGPVNMHTSDVPKQSVPPEYRNPVQSTSTSENIQTQ